MCPEHGTFLEIHTAPDDVANTEFTRPLLLDFCPGRVCTDATVVAVMGPGECGWTPGIAPSRDPLRCLRRSTRKSDADETIAIVSIRGTGMLEQVQECDLRIRSIFPGLEHFYLKVVIVAADWNGVICDEAPRELFLVHYSTR